ncbi:ABC transporter substrate-binding protein [Citricoccus sp. SGAir0253]|uniref:ABC transporter substrate-binding protein n=1 Tax=Citricoccus sp. SGAir0253 TaxID=2567881 RepID=UPI0010CCF1A8|nr:ABC transporter substrate-binding protein [Citricoccus sp. SGAir0253]QCU77140.1 ABC transporter substrate-binding protein [Citricoccus sp. SGAir0253]
MDEQPPAPRTVRITAAGPDRPRHRWRTRALWLGALALVGALTLALAVVPGEGADGDAAGAPTTAPTTAGELRLGYFGTIPHAPALIGVQEGLFADALAEAGGTALRTEVFTAGPAAVEALNAGAIDAAYLGPGPALNSFAQSDGESLLIVAGAASGGVQLVVRRGIDAVEQLRGTVLATPQLGGTQDIALRSFLQDRGLSVSPAEDADVSVNPTANAQTLQLFRDGKVDGAWLPEPWASRLVLEAGAEVLVDEAELWTGEQGAEPGRFPTAVLVVNRDFAAAHPATVEALLRGHVEALEWLEDAPEAERAAGLNTALERTAGAGLRRDVMDRSLEHIEFTADPLAGTYPTLQQDGVDVGLGRPADLTDLVDLGPLERVLAEAGDTDRADVGGPRTDSDSDSDAEETP